MPKAIGWEHEFMMPYSVICPCLPLPAATNSSNQACRLVCSVPEVLPALLELTLWGSHQQQPCTALLWAHHVCGSKMKNKQRAHGLPWESIIIRLPWIINHGNLRSVSSGMDLCSKRGEVSVFVNYFPHFYDKISHRNHLRGSAHGFRGFGPQFYYVS